MEEEDADSIRGKMYRRGLGVSRQGQQEEEDAGKYEV